MQNAEAEEKAADKKFSEDCADVEDEIEVGQFINLNFSKKFNYCVFLQYNNCDSILIKSMTEREKECWWECRWWRTGSNLWWRRWRRLRWGWTRRGRRRRLAWWRWDGIWGRSGHGWEVSYRLLFFSPLLPKFPGVREIYSPFKRNSHSINYF